MSNIKDTLFEGVNPIGQQLQMQKNIDRVIGVIESKGDMTSSSDDAILSPLTAMQQMVAQPRTSRGERVVSSIALTVNGKEWATYVADEITSLLRSRHQLGPGVEAEFSMYAREGMGHMRSEAVGTMSLLLGGIAALSLLGGGIGGMNIMVVAVLERTREIGIRKALGARQRDIWGQFLIEAAFLSFTGGIIGVIVGWVVSYAVNSMGTMTTVVTADIVILAVSVSVGIGLFFGFYPAWNASRLNPIDALRSE